MRSPIVIALMLAVAGIATAPDRAGASTPQHCMTPSAPGQALDRIAAGDAATSHPLIGRVIFSTPRANPSDCRTIDLSSAIVASMMDGGGVLILGEVHDNPIHHRIRAAFIRSARGSKPDGPTGDFGRRARAAAIVFEHLRADQAAALGKLQAKDGTPLVTIADEWLAALEWDKSGWPDKAMFKPLFEEVIAGKHPVYPAEPARGTVRDIARQGFQAVDGEEIKRLKLDKPLSAPLQNALLDELEASHCGLMPRTAFGKMAEAQRYRDAHYAAVIDAAAETHKSGVVLLAGNGHVRRDRGVPYYLAMRGKQAFAVALVEVEDGKTNPDAYIERGPDGSPIYDAILFTTRAERKDPCEEMRAMMQKKK